MGSWAEPESGGLPQAICEDSPMLLLSMMGSDWVIRFVRTILLAKAWRWPRGVRLEQGHHQPGVVTALSLSWKLGEWDRADLVQALTSEG